MTDNQRIGKSSPLSRKSETNRIDLTKCEDKKSTIDVENARETMKEQFSDEKIDFVVRKPKSKKVQFCDKEEVFQIPTNGQESNPYAGPKKIEIGTQFACDGMKDRGVKQPLKVGVDSNNVPENVSSWKKLYDVDSVS